MLRNRVLKKELIYKIKEAEEAVKIIENNMLVAMGGYTSSGYPKIIANELAKKWKHTDNQIRLLTGANVAGLDKVLSKNNLISRRIPMLANKNLRNQVNDGEVDLVEQQMNKMHRLIETNSFGRIDIAIIEALAITKEGYIIPTSSIGMVPNILDMADKIIIEINEVQPLELKELHDIYRQEKYPYRKPIPITNVNDRIGVPYIEVDVNKIESIISSNVLDVTMSLNSETDSIRRLSNNFIEFMIEEIEVNYDGWTPPMQLGFGNIASGIAEALKKSEINNLKLFCGGISEAGMKLIKSDKVTKASTGSIEMTENVIKLLKSNIDLYKEKLVLRNADITNNGEVINRLGVVAINSGIEIDIYGNLNSSHIYGRNIINGIGGGANFASNSSLSIVVIESVNKDKNISNIVPMTFHQDISEHDVDVLITENGVADLRGLTELERAKLIIDNCSDPIYREQLNKYLSSAELLGGHRPQNPVEAYKWYENLKEKNTMIFNKED